MGKIRKISQPDWLPSIYWCAVVLIYYYVFLITAAAAYHRYSNFQVEESVLAVYISIVKSTPLEVIATTLVTSLYLLQMNSKSALADQNKNLESIVKARTVEVQSANEKLKHLNEELMSSNEKIKLANDNLEDMVEERTKQINDQLSQLLKYAHMNFVNDSAPMHFASAMNAPVAAVYCSTVPEFGYGPLSDIKYIIQRHESLYCRPCGLHGFATCPEGHFKCALEIEDEQLLGVISSE